MRIIVEWSGQEPQTVICDETDTIAGVKQTLLDQGTPLPGGTKLWFGGAEVKDTHKLGAQGLEMKSGDRLTDTNKDADSNKKRKTTESTTDSSKNDVALLHKRLMDSERYASLSDPNKLSWLPFPMEKFPYPNRFVVVDKRVKFMGRKCLDKFEQRVIQFLDDGKEQQMTDNDDLGNAKGPESFHQLLVYGTTGAGKSHLLLMLALRLRKKFLTESPVKRRIVILPSAAALISGRFPYLMAALRLACADSEPDSEELATIDNEKALSAFCEKGTVRYIFIVDQADALEHVTSTEGDESLAFSTAKYAKDVLTNVVGGRNYVIYGSSANNVTASRRFNGKQQMTGYYDIFGGFDYEEMGNWLDVIGEHTLSDAQKQQLFMDTGGIPLFLDWFWQGVPPTDFSTDDKAFLHLVNLFKNNDFCIAAVGEVESWVLSSISIPDFGKLANAFLTEGVLPNGFTHHSYNHRYFYMTDRTCYTVSGFLKKQLALSLRKHIGSAPFLTPQWFDKVREEATSAMRNNAVLGFLVEQAVISLIATTGLVLDNQARTFKAVHFDKGNERSLFPKEKDLLLLPTAFNYPNVDMVLSLNDKKKPYRIGVQVTLQDYASHEQSATQFMNTEICANWVGVDTNVESYQWHFLWIMPEKKIDLIKDLPSLHMSETHKTRARHGGLRQVEFVEHFTTFGQINPQLKIIDDL